MNPKSDSISGVMQMLSNSEHDNIPDKYKHLTGEKNA